MNLPLNKVFFVLISAILLSSSLYSFDSSNWQYKVGFNLTSSNSTLTDFQVLLVLNDTNINYSHTNNDGSDLKFTWLNTTSGEEQEIPYWIDNQSEGGWNKSGDSYVWIKAPLIDTDGEQFYYYYGNTTAVKPGTNGDKTFIFFDDFDSEGVNTSKWNITGYTSYVSEEGGYLKLERYDKNPVEVKTFSSFPNEDISLDIMQEPLDLQGSGQGATWFKYRMLKNGSDWYEYAYDHYYPRHELMKSGTIKKSSDGNGYSNNQWFISFIRKISNKIEIGRKSTGPLVTWNDSSSLTKPGIIDLIVDSGGGGNEVKFWYNYVILRKYSSDIITQSFGTEEKTEHVSISFKDKYKLSDEVIITLKNDGNKNVTNVSLDTSGSTFACNLSKTTFDLIQPNEEKQVTLTYDNSLPQIQKIKINFYSNELNTSEEKTVVFYNEQENNLTAEVKASDTNKTEKVYQNFTLEFRNQGWADYNLTNFHYEANNPHSTCYENGKQVNTSDYTSYFSINEKIVAGENKTINCVLTSNGNIFTEKPEEQNPEKQTNTTLAYTRIPLEFNNPYNSNITINWVYNKTSEINRTQSNTSGEIILQAGENKTIYLEMNRSVNITLLNIINYSSGEINPADKYLEAYALMNISNNDSINYNHVKYHYENESYYEPVEYINALSGNNTNKVLVKISITSTEKKLGNLKTFNYSGNKEVIMNHSGNFHVYNLAFEYQKGDWDAYLLYRCIYDNASKCNTSNTSDWNETSSIDKGRLIKTLEINNMSDLVYVISYEEKSKPPKHTSSGGGGGGGGGGYTPFNITNITISQNKSSFLINVSLNKMGKCNYSLDNQTSTPMNGSKLEWFTNLNLTGDHSINITCIYSHQKITKTLQLKYNQEKPAPVPLINNQTEEDKPIEENNTSSNGFTGFVIGSGNLLLGGIVLFLALAGYYAYSKKDALKEVKFPELKLFKKKKKVKKERRKVGFDASKLKPVREKEKTVEVNEIKRKDIEENVVGNKPLAVQRICRYIKEDGSKINYSIPELSTALNLSLISVRIAIRHGLALGIFEKYENGRFRAYRLGKYGKIIADLEVDLKTYSELETVVKLIKKREQEEN